MGKKGKRKNQPAARDAEKKTEEPVEVEEVVPANEEETEVIKKGKTAGVEDAEAKGEKDEPE